MADMTSANLTALIQVQHPVSDASRAGLSTTRTDDDNGQAKARDVANRFEALLIHNMLKGMRKTTLAENTSNQRALYDDMLDQSLADSMMKAGGLGIADQLMSQLNGSRSSSTSERPAATAAGQTMTRDRLRLRELAMSIDGKRQNPASEAATAESETQTVSGDVNGLERLKLLSRLWGQEGTAPPGNSNRVKSEFLETLAPHARRSAERLGTSTSAVLAIAALETGWGRSLPRDASGASGHNYFGIKASAKDQEYTRNMTTEYVNGKSQTLEARFKSYGSTADSVAGFADFLLENPRYSTALQHAGNPERFLRELHDAGYATDPRYAEKAIMVMRQVEQHTSQP